MSNYRYLLSRKVPTLSKMIVGKKIVKQKFNMDPFSPSLFLFCGKSSRRMKALFWEGDGFVLLYKRLENGKYKWPRTPEQVRLLTAQEFRWLMEGLSIEQPRAIRKVKPGEIC